MTQLPEINTTLETLLIRCCAAVDATFTGPRDLGASWGPWWVRRMGYAENGIPAPSAPDRAVAGRMAQSRGLRELQRKGYLTLIAAEAKAVQFRLTTPGYMAARELCYLPPLDLEVLQTIHHASEADPRAVDGEDPDRPWLPEILTIPDGAGWEGVPGSFKACIAPNEDKLLPLIVAGWLDTNFTAHRKMFMRLTEAGLQVAKGASVPDLDIDLPNVSADEHDRNMGIYEDEFTATRLSLQALECGSDIGRIPLPVSMLPRSMSHLVTSTLAKS